MPGGVAAVIGAFAARLGLDTTDYARGILNASAVTEIFGQRFATFVSNPLLGSIQLFKDAGQAALGMASQALDTAESISIFAAEVNASTGFLQALKAQYEAAGRSFEASKPTLKEVAAAIEEAKDAASAGAVALDRIGVSLAGVTDTGDALALIIDGLAGVADESERVNLAMEILGRRSGPEVLAVIGATNGAVEEMIRHARALGLVMSEDTLTTLGALDDKLDEVQQAIAGVKQTASAAFLRGFASEFLDGAAGVESFAQAINQKVEPAAETLGIKVGEIVGNLDLIIARLEKIAKYGEEIAESSENGWSWITDLKWGEVTDPDFYHGTMMEMTRRSRGDAAANAYGNSIVNGGALPEYARLGAQR